MRRFVESQMVGGVAGYVQAFESQGADLQARAVVQVDVRVDGAGGMRSHGGAGQTHRFGVSLGVVGMPVRVDDVGHREPLRGGSLGHHARRIGWVDQDGGLRIAVAEHVAEVPVAAGSDLFKHKLHECIFYALRGRAVRPARPRRNKGSLAAGVRGNTGRGGYRRREQSRRKGSVNHA